MHEKPQLKKFKIAKLALLRFIMTWISKAHGAHDGTGEQVSVQLLAWKCRVEPTGFVWGAMLSSTSSSNKTDELDGCAL